MSEHLATIEWHCSGPDFLKGKYSREHTWTFDGGVTVPASPAPSVVPAPWSTPAAVDPEEAFVASIASCHMLTFVWLASCAGFAIERYRDRAVGTMAKNERGIPWVNAVTLRPEITWSGVKRPSEAEVEHLHHRAHDHCFIANSVKTEIKVEPPLMTADAAGAGREFWCFGHRGAAGHEPENTLRSIRRALELGAHGIEIDVRRVDGELLVFHDTRLDRTTNGRGFLARKKLAELRALDAGKGERIPTLREVFETVDRRAVINVELKGRRTARLVEALILEFITQRGWRYEDFLVSSFLQLELRALRDPQIRRGLLLARPTRLCWMSARRVRAWSVNPSLAHTRAAFVEEARRRGLRVFVYTVNEPHDLARMRDLGVDGVITDFPDRVVGTRPA